MKTNQQQHGTEDHEHVKKVTAMHRLLLFDYKRMTYVEARQNYPLRFTAPKVFEPVFDHSGRTDNRPNSINSQLA